MNVLMFTNVYRPHVGGVARAVETLRVELRRLGHSVAVVAPELGHTDDEDDITRVPAVQNFNGSDFAVAGPMLGRAWQDLLDRPVDVVHSHHPFLLGDTALRFAAERGLPVVFTHHTRYEDYTHYVPGDSPALRRFVIELATGYANLCDAVIAPSESIADLLRSRGVESPIHPVPTGIDPATFAAGDGAAARRRAGIPADAPLVGHVGRLAPEKNLEWLGRVLAGLARDRPDVHVLVVGTGPSKDAVRDAFARAGVDSRLHFAGILERSQLADAYHAMDVFAFSSHTETQGLVLAEALSAGVPVVALDAPGAREITIDGVNGHLLPDEDAGAFASAVLDILERRGEERAALQRAARASSAPFSVEPCTERLVAVYRSLERRRDSPPDDSVWDLARRRIEAEWDLLVNVASAAVDAVTGSTDDADD